jgi:molybdopterin-guanine dinucleotide biosynthesis protein A
MIHSAENLTISIQAGGKSQRMGQNKALLLFQGLPLVQRVIERLQPVAAEIIVITNTPADYSFLKLPLFKDLIPGKGALGGLYTALKTARHPYVAAVGCDMPFVNPTLLAAEYDLLLASGADVVIPQTSSGLEPLHAVYRRDTCKAWVQQALEEEQYRLAGWLDQAAVRVMTPLETSVYDPTGRAFININTPEDLLQASQLTG